MILSLGELAEALGAELHGDPSCQIERIATLSNAGPGSLTFLSNRRYRRYLKQTRASAVLLAPEDLPACPVAALVTDNPYLGCARAARLLHPEPEISPGRDAAATVSGDAHVHDTAWVGPQAVIGPGAYVGPRVLIGPGCVVDENVTIGEDSRLVANVTLCHDVKIGRRTLLHPGVVIGGDGFGLAKDNGVWIKVPQLGAVHIGDDVEIGANSTVDRGAVEDTVIEDGVKLDNLIQIGHNVRVGAHTVIAACVAIGGSTRIGKRCAIGGAASIADHVEIADDVYLTARSAVPGSIKEPGVYSSGMPIVQENRLWRKNIVRVRQLDDIVRRLKRLENERK